MQNKKFRVCVLGMGDCGSSQKATINSISDSISENLFKQISTAKSSSSQNCQVKQNIAFVIGEGAELDCPIVSSNTAVSVCNMSNVLTQNSNTDLKTLLKQSVDQSATTAAKSVQDFLTTTTSSQDSNVNMSQYVKNLIDKEFTNDMAQECIQSSNVDQNNTYVLGPKAKQKCPPGGSISFSNDTQATAIASCVGTQLAGILSSDSVTQSIVGNTTSGSDSTSKGFGDLVTGFLNSLSGPMKYLIIGVVIVIVVCVIGAAIILLSPAGQDATRDLSKAASKKIGEMK